MLKYITAIALCVPPTWSLVVPCRWAQQGLLQIATQYAGAYSTPSEIHRRSLRWSIADSPLLESGLSLLPRSQALRSADPDPYSGTPESEQSMQDFVDSAFAALKQLDEERVFGVGTERENVILSVWLHDESHEMKIDAAGKLNSKVAVSRYRVELEDGLSAFREWQALRQP